MDLIPLYYSTCNLFMQGWQLIAIFVVIPTFSLGYMQFWARHLVIITKTISIQLPCSVSKWPTSSISPAARALHVPPIACSSYQVDMFQPTLIRFDPPKSYYTQLNQIPPTHWVNLCLTIHARSSTRPRLPVVLTQFTHASLHTGENFFDHDQDLWLCPAWGVPDGQEPKCWQQLCY